MTTLREYAFRHVASSHCCDETLTALEKVLGLKESRKPRTLYCDICLEAKGVATPHRRAIEFQDERTDEAHIDAIDVTTLPGDNNWITLMTFRQTRFKIMIITRTVDFA